jgi:hypothetical protein
VIKQALEEYARSLQRQWPDRTKTVGASEIGQCSRKTAWAKRSHPPDDGYANSWGANVRGSLMEKHFWLPAVRAKYGDKVRFAGDEQTSFEDKFLSATPDALVCGLPRDAIKDLKVPDIGSDCLLLECKTVDPRVNLYKEKDQNHFQVQVQIGVVRAVGAFMPNYALISYVDASFWNEVAEFPVAFDEGIYDAAQARARNILTLDPRELKPEGFIAGGSECEYCPFAKPCGVIRRSVPTDGAEADPQFAAEIADLCRDAISAQDQADQASAEVRDVHQQIKDRLRAKKVRRIKGVVTWSTQKGRKSYDGPALREAAERAGVDVEAYATTGEPTDRLQILLGRSRSGASDQ